MQALFYALLLLSVLSRATIAEEPLWDLCDKGSNTSRSGQISRNIDDLLAKLVSGIPSTGFLATSVGKNKDQVFGLAQCRGDVSRTNCSECVATAAEEVKKRCPDQVGARIWYDFCFLRYKNEDFVGKLDTSIGLIYYNLGNVTDPESFNRELGALMDRIRSEALVPANKGLGKGQTKLSAFVTLYGLVQCFGDISKLDCAQCLATALESFQTVCHNRKGCRVLYSSCYVRYELYPFFFPLDPSETQITATSMALVYP